MLRPVKMQPKLLVIGNLTLRRWDFTQRSFVQIVHFLLHDPLFLFKEKKKVESYWAETWL